MYIRRIEREGRRFGNRVIGYRLLRPKEMLQREIQSSEFDSILCIPVDIRSLDILSLGLCQIYFDASSMNR